ncbi:NADPH-dependent FMN reductase [Streptomyces sp. NPDC002073]
MSMVPMILLLSGSVRTGSSNESVLRTAQAVAASSQVRTVLYEGLPALPHFNPADDTDPLPAPVAELRAAIDEASAVLICTPEYAGTLPGAFKNLLDWTVGGTEICDKPVAWVNAAAPGRGQGAEATLRTVLDYTGAHVVEAACARIPVGRQMVDAGGLVTDEGVRERLGEIVTLLAAPHGPVAEAGTD